MYDTMRFSLLLRLKRRKPAIYKNYYKLAVAYSQRPASDTHKNNIVLFLLLLFHNFYK